MSLGLTLALLRLLGMCAALEHSAIGVRNAAQREKTLASGRVHPCSVLKLDVEQREARIPVQEQCHGAHREHIDATFDEHVSKAAH